MPAGGDAISPHPGHLPVQVRLEAAAPAGWNQFLARVPEAELAADADWHALAAAHYPGGRAPWLVATAADGELLGALPLLARRRWRCERLESSLEGTLAGPQVAADLPAYLQDDVHAALCAALAGRLGGRTVMVAFTVAGPIARRRASTLAGTGPWQVVPFASAVVDCRPGLAAIERDAWTNNRRNERNRGLKRGCSLLIERDPATLTQWYPLYRSQAERWLQVPIPSGFLHDLLRHYREQAFMTTVRLEGRLIGAHLCLVSRDRLVPFLSGADPDLAGTHFPHTLLYWHDIKTACELGLAAVDFGGCAGRDSLWDFKRRCGGQSEERLSLQAWSRTGHWLHRLASLRRWRRKDGG